MNVKAVLVERVSKAGNPYTAIEVYITNDIKKVVFLTQAELALVKMNTTKTN